MKYSAYLLATLTMVLTFALGTASAQNLGASAKVTPSAVFQVVNEINMMLAAFHKANGSSPKSDANAPALTPRLPRHVYQKAREVFDKVQLLRVINGFSTNPTPPFPQGEVAPGDVRAIAMAIMAEVHSMRDTFGVGGGMVPAQLPSGKTPTDVYQNLVATGLLIDGLGIPNIVPNDVYRVALAINRDLEVIRAARGVNEPIATLAASSRKKPQAVFEAGLELITAMQSLSDGENPLAPPGGVVPLNSRSGKIRPGHVLDLLNNVLAEVGSIKVVLGITEPTDWPVAQSGKTPSDVFDAVTTAIQMVESLNTST